jgi:hypothetical protein
MRKFVSLAIVLFLFGSLGLARLADPFEGTKWNVVVTPDASAAGNDKEFKDVLIFKGGMFRATECEKHGFKPVHYDDNTTRFGPATFTAEQSSEKEGKTKWSGTVAANQITGDMAWTNSFKGERQN